MKKLLNLCLLCSLQVLFLVGCSNSTGINVVSPNGILQTQVVLDPTKHQLMYDLSFVSKDGNKMNILESSPLGLLYDEEDFSSGVKIKSISSVTEVVDSYRLYAGKTSDVNTKGNAFTVTLENENKKNLLVHFRVYDDGLAFQYEIPGEGTARIYSEETAFSVVKDVKGKAWIHPYDKAAAYSPAYESYFENGIAIGTPAPENMAGWAYPALFNANEKWCLITEAGSESFLYGGTHLQPSCEDGIYKVAFASADEALNVCGNEPEVSLPFKTNWRVIIAGEDKGSIVTSNLVQTLNAPNQFTDTDWIIPGIAAWSWWSDLGSPKNYKKMLPFIDMTSSLGWPYFLVDANWNIMEGGTIEQLVEYARNKNVGLFLWYNSGGAHNTVTEQPRDVMNDPVKRKAAMEWMQKIGIKGIKVDFFQSDKPYIMKQYQDILEDAMAYHILVNMHGCTLPRGWERTYPNLVTMESVRGAENYITDINYPEKAPVMNTIYPFTRNVVGGMDYTPSICTNQQYPHLTSLGHELALPVLFQSGVTHIADGVKEIENTPVYVKDFLKKIPASWDEIKYLSGQPGEDVILARRKGDVWYVAGINGEKKDKRLAVDTSFIPDNYTMTLITDGGDKGYSIQTADVTENFSIDVLPYGGFVATFCAN